MNAERDVQRMVAHWLAEEAAVRAPDRVLDSARRTIDRTRQRRFVAAWREPVYLSPFKLATAAAVVAVAVVGAALLGRATAPANFGGQPSIATTPSPTAATVTLEAFRNARDEICNRYVAATDPLRPKFENLYDPADTPSERAPKIAALDDFATQYDLMIEELATLDAPPEIAEDHAATMARFDAVASLIHGIVERLNDGDLAGAESRDLATNPIANQIVAFETQYTLVGCP